jgi:DNA anti-recombination protein RmuC
MGELKDYGVLGVCVAALVFCIWKILWPALEKRDEALKAQNAAAVSSLENLAKMASDRADRQEERLDRIIATHDARFAEQAKDFTSALRDTNETHRHRLDRLVAQKKRP